MNEKRIEWDFSYHKPVSEKALKHEKIRAQCRELALMINQVVPDCREKSLAITKLEEAMMWTNAGLAREPRPNENSG